MNTSIQKWQIELIKDRLSEAKSPQAVFITNDTVIKRQKKRLKTKLTEMA